MYKLRFSSIHINLLRGVGNQTTFILKSLRLLHKWYTIAVSKSFFLGSSDSHSQRNAASSSYISHIVPGDDGAVRRGLIAGRLRLHRGPRLGCARRLQAQLQLRPA